MVKRAHYSREAVRHILAAVKDPEIPVLSIEEMGILRRIESEHGHYEIVITPTYTGCPAMGMIEQDIRAALQRYGISDVQVTTALSPAWTTDWMTAASREKLRQYGIAPPAHSSCNKNTGSADLPVSCPRCNSAHVTLVSRFGSTACKSLYTCNDCKEPFDYFKCH